MIKFLVTGGILTLRSSKIIPIECAMVSGPEDQPLPVNKVKEERVKVAINPEHPEQTVMISSNLTKKARVKLCNLLQWRRIAWDDDDDVLDVLSLDSNIDKRKSLEVMCTSKRYAWPNCKVSKVCASDEGAGSRPADSPAARLAIQLDGYAVLRILFLP
ncbi:hypothetical protein Tco_1012039 [Tanacetum coccineum]